MGGNPATRNSKLRCTYHKDHGHLIEHCKTLKQFLEGVVSKGHLAEYVKDIEKAKKKENGDIDEDEEPIKKPTNRLVTSVIDVISSITARDEMTKNAIKVPIKRDQCVQNAFASEVMSINAYEDDIKNKSYELTFTNKDMQGVDTSHNDTSVLTVNINTFDLKMLLINPGSSSEIMYRSLFDRLKLPAS